ncbi:MAG: phosphate--AMP phosphotransferase, partial [Eubacterium sp.]|nr:phosphate--AMP phosphotransferase [Eubacterium sp.]
MLEKIDVNKKLKSAEYDALMEPLVIRIGELQRRCKEEGIPLVIFMEGLEASGKGTMINRMIRPLDPRGFQVFTMEKESEDDAMHPYLWRFLTKMPARGRIGIFDSSWYQGVRQGLITPEELADAERQLTDDGAIVAKFFLLISKEEQANRLKNLDKNKETKWRVKEKDWKENKKFDKALAEYDEILHASDKANAPWTIVEAMDKRYATYKIIQDLVQKMEAALGRKNKPDPIYVEEDKADLRNRVLQGIDLNKSLTQEEYRKKKKDLQARLSRLHNEMYLQRLPVVLAFEGWDAGGKG